MRIRKAIIPAAGLGTRLLPATKAQPKEMLPIVDKPTIQYIVEEAAASGIEDIIIVTGRNKKAIEDHFDKSFELEETLKKSNSGMLESVQKISNLANIHYIRQKEPLGLGHAIHCAKSFIGDEPFAVLLGDDIVCSEVPCIKQLMDIYDRYQATVLGVQQVPSSEVNKYGIIDSYTIDARSYGVTTLVEKPPVSEAPSNLAILGRYIITPAVFECIERTQPGKNGEIQLTDALKLLAQQESMYAYDFIGKRYDVGDRFGFIRATIEIALNRDDLRDSLYKYIKEKMHMIAC